MIRIIDEPVFELTTAEMAQALLDYDVYAKTKAADGFVSQSFEGWLMNLRAWPHTVQGRIKP